jgi:predicted dehydrogenase
MPPPRRLPCSAWPATQGEEEEGNATELPNVSIDKERTMIKVGLIGLGGMGNKHLGCHGESDVAEVVAVADVRPERLRPGQSSQQINIGAGGGRIDPEKQRLYTSAEELIADDDVELVDICLPTFLHARYCIKALKAGKHVVCEKPMALSYADCCRVIRAAVIAPGRLMIAQVVRFFPAYEALKEAFDSGRLGALKHLSMFRLSAPPRWSWDGWLLDHERSGGALVDLHVHDADFVHYLLGEPKAVFARGAKGPSGGWDTVTASYVYDADVAVNVTGSWAMPDSFAFTAGFTAAFENGCLVHSLTAAEPLVEMTADGKRAVPLEARDGYAEELRYFIGCIGRGQEPKKVMPASSAYSIKLVEAERKSMESGRVVKV